MVSDFLPRSDRWIASTSTLTCTLLWPASFKSYGSSTRRKLPRHLTNQKTMGSLPRSSPSTRPSTRASRSTVRAPLFACFPTVIPHIDLGLSNVLQLLPRMDGLVSEDCYSRRYQDRKDIRLYGIPSFCDEGARRRRHGERTYSITNTFFFSFFADNPVERLQGLAFRREHDYRTTSQIQVANVPWQYPRKTCNAPLSTGQCVEMNTRHPCSSWTIPTAAFFSPLLSTRIVRTL
jgi:hypothetical protein